MEKQELQDELTITLRKPITLGTGMDAETYTVLNLREPEVKEVLAFSRRSAKDPADAMRHLIAEISTVPLAVIDKVKARDFAKAANYLSAFMEQDGEDTPSGEGSDDETGK